MYSKITSFVLPTLTKHQEGFWPITNWQRDHACSMSSGVGLDVSSDTAPQDDPEPYPYCGPAKLRPKPCFNPYQDVLLRNFVLCHLCDEHRLLVWLGRTSSTVDLFPDSNYGIFVVDWWRVMCLKKKTKSLIVRECWTK